MVIKSFSKTGRYHEELKEVNQDYLHSTEEKNYLTVMVADGATACKKGLEGAKLSCEAISDIIKREGIGFFDYSKAKAAYLLTEHILYFIEKGKNKEFDLSEYGSTVAFAVMEKKTGRTALINLGDGAILSVTDRGYDFLMWPKRYYGNPCLTTTEGADRAVRISQANLNCGDRIVVCSDGFLAQLGKERVLGPLKRNDIEALNDALQRECTMDDCSYITFTREGD